MSVTRSITIHVGSTGAAPPPPPPPPPTGLPMLIGCNDFDYTAFHATLDNPTGSKPGGVGHGLQIRRSYITGTTPANFAGTIAGSDAAAGRVSLLSISGENPATVASGSRAAAITAFFSTVPPGHKAYIVFWSEADQDSAVTANLASVPAAWHNLHTYLVNSTADLSLVKIGPLLTASGYGTGGNDLGARAAYFPVSAADYDFMAVDFYEFWRPPGWPDPTLGIGQQRPPEFFLTTVQAIAAADNKPILVGEHSSHTMPAHLSYYSSGTTPDTLSRPWRLQRVVDYCDNAGNIEAFCLFHYGAGANAPHGPWWQDCVHDYVSVNDRSVADPDHLTQIRKIISVRGPTPG